jgi:hypothetical protein
MLNFPRGMIKLGMQLSAEDVFDKEIYYATLEELHQQTKQHLTTKTLAKYVLNTTANSRN